MITKKDISKLESLMLLSAFEEGTSKRQVADALNLSTDTLNKYLSDFEQDLGIKLLTSNGRGSMLTSHARSLLRLSQELKTILRSVDCVSSVRNKLCGTVRVGMSMAVSSVFSIKGINAFFDNYPDIKIESIITEEQPDIQVQSVDVGITHAEPAGADLVIVGNCNLPCALYASPGYIARYGKPQNREDLFNNHRICGKLERHSTVCGWNIKTWKEIFNSAKNISYLSNSNEDLLKAVHQDVGISLMPSVIGQHGLVLIDNLGIDAVLKLYLVAHRQTKDIPKIRVVIDYYKGLLQNLRC